MRTHNVKALAELLREAEAATTNRGLLADAGRANLDDPGRLAEWLVEAGAVLVPSAVTEQEAMDLLHRASTEVPVNGAELSRGPWFRESLCRIASEGGSGRRDEEWADRRPLKGTHRKRYSPARSDEHSLQRPSGRAVLVHS